MKFIRCLPWAFLGIVPLLGAQTASDPNEGLRLEATGSGSFQLSWFGRPQRTYTFDLSEDLVNWVEAPFVDVGTGSPLRYGAFSSGARLFFRLRFADFLDTDLDGIADWEEQRFGTSLVLRDTDGDGIPDAWEIEHGMNPLSAADAASDFDTDTANNLAEYLAGTPMGTPPVLNDGNANGIPDCYEHAAGVSLLQGASQGSFTMSYEYDALGRLVSGPGRTYGLDAEGNLLGATP